MDEHALAQRDWNLRYDQLGRGRFSGEFLQVSLPKEMLVFQERYNIAVRQRGSLGTDSFVCAIPMRANGEMSVNGVRVPGDHAIVCNDAEFDIRTPGNFDVCGIAIQVASVRQALSRIYKEEPHILSRQQLAAPRLDEAAGARLRQQLSAMLEGLRLQPELLEDSDARHIWTDQVLIELLEALPIPPGDTHERSAAQRKRLVDRACEVMLAQPDEPISILEVCSAVAASRRKLNYAFQDVLGMGPVAYQRALRLNGVRRQLQRCEDALTGVYNVAVRWGFWHFGQFSTDYKNFFGELPSETLQGARQARGMTAQSLR
ncbi:helix-turn-helix domain-containing protein [Cupriavidus basilensis]|uniref:Helix-turn-helix domain-containing protein n=1 Tax=Cupriavidus basilensis TaxID=68895 RepID=A0A7M2HB11_9BURK|nr:helix-turn-helix domain-containing protein [Cupriavidus basilensis]QOT82038.1 helix-turn-helix domain-containing protein [Cupriavidus basilensis]